MRSEQNHTRFSVSMLKIPALVIVLLALVAYPTYRLFKYLNKKDQDAVVTVKAKNMPPAYKKWAKYRRYINVAGLPDFIKIEMDAAIDMLNGVSRHYKLPNRFVLSELTSPPKDGILIEFEQHMGNGCATPNGDLGWFFKFPDVRKAIIRLCVSKGLEMLKLVGSLYLNSNMAQQMKAWKRPWMCVISHEIFHAEYWEHTNHGGILYKDDNAGISNNKFLPTTCELSEYDIKLWGALYKETFKRHFGVRNKGGK